jgi:alkanesulfonate monooxygenase SsuD/methylene tetrahydromethanopterin reductase-like flavin-dependent oxidoreductase (luciferase family)
VRPGTSIAVASARSPVALAYTADDLRRFSGGRFSLGLGSQVKAHITRRFSMPWGRPEGRELDARVGRQPHDRRLGPRSVVKPRR